MLLSHVFSFPFFCREESKCKGIEKSYNTATMLRIHQGMLKRGAIKTAAILKLVQMSLTFF
ncbi:MAG: hypothetical protein BGO67_06695 [Alphaproteobacteria bacterium 41-28]|nr:MAG: hypothetical protein BGO67_06695 [Alphaproteobacteria bacterium 41-28]